LKAKNNFKKQIKSFTTGLSTTIQRSTSS